MNVCPDFFDGWMVGFVIGAFFICVVVWLTNRFSKRSEL